MISKICISLGENWFFCWINPSAVDDVFDVNLQTIEIRLTDSRRNKWIFKNIFTSVQLNVGARHTTVKALVCSLLVNVTDKSTGDNQIILPT